MSQATAVQARRQIRRALGPQAVGVVADHERAIRVFAEILTRGFFGRLKWLLRGR